MRVDWSMNQNIKSFNENNVSIHYLKKKNIYICIKNFSFTKIKQNVQAKYFYVYIQLYMYVEMCVLLNKDVYMT